MGASITVRDIDPGDNSWLRREARQIGVSMEELVRRLIHEQTPPGGPNCCLNPISPCRCGFCRSSIVRLPGRPIC